MSIDPVALKILMEKDGSTIASLAKRVEISPQYMGDIVAGRRHLKRNPGLLKRIAEALNVPQSMIEHRGSTEAVVS